MSVSLFNSLDILNKYEKRFVKELEENSIKILREIKVTREEIDEMAIHINIVLNLSSISSLRDMFPLSVSLFLVWCTVYEYKDGDMWSNIFNKLGLQPSIHGQVNLGGILLKTISKYNLMQIKEGEGKKYLSPILMHGYISNHYAFDLFDYLNKVYSSILEEDTSESAINEIWNDVFGDHMKIKNIREERKQLEDKKQALLMEINELSEIDEKIKNISYEYLNDLETEVANLEDLLTLYKTQEEKLEKQIKLSDKIKFNIDLVDKSIDKLNNISKSDINYSNLEEVNRLLNDVNNILKTKSIEALNKKENLFKEIKGLNNKLVVKKETLVSIKAAISTLGKGILSEGWLAIEEFRELEKEIESIEAQIKRNKKQEDVLSLDKNTTVEQLLTASLNNLRSTSPTYFKKFMIKTIQMFGHYFTHGQADENHPLYEVFMEWINREPVRQEYPEILSKQTTRTSRRRGKRLILQRMKKPYLKFDTNKLLLYIIVPEQKFSLCIDYTQNPHYKIMERDGQVNTLNIDYYYHGQSLYIKEMNIPLNSSSYKYFLFEWYNLKESHNISLDEIMIIDESGNIKDSNKIGNGYYFIQCNKKWNIDASLIVNEHPTILEDYKILEVYLYETKVSLYSQEDNKFYEVLATDQNIVTMNNFDVIEGVYVNDTPVIAGLMPEVTINYLGVNPEEIFFSIFIDDYLTLKRGLDYFIDKDIYKVEESTIRINIYKLLKLKRQMTAHKFKLILHHAKGKDLLNEEFYFLPRTKLTYITEGLKVRLGTGMRISNKGYVQNGTEYIIPLKDEDGENFEIYYDKQGWIKFWVEVPSVSARLIDDSGVEYSKEDILYGSKRERIKNFTLHLEAKSSRVKSILLFDNSYDYETILYLKDGKVRTSIGSYYDILNGEEKGQLFYKIEDKHVSIDKQLLLEVYDKWKVENIIVHQKEMEDEYILGIDYEENFAFNGSKYLKVINENKDVFQKTIKEQLYIYVKKKDLISSNITLVIGYEEEYEDIFGKVKKNIEAGRVDVKLKSKLGEIEKILTNNILVTEFKYQGREYEFKYPIELGPIYRASSKNFEDEEIYMTELYNNGNIEKVYFYIDTEKKIIPFIIDDDYDGAQYSPKSGQIFWELSSDKEIMAPIEHIKYVIKGEL